MKKICQADADQQHNNIMPGLLYQDEYTLVPLKEWGILISLSEPSKNQIKDPPGNSAHDDNQKDIQYGVNGRVLMEDDILI